MTIREAVYGTMIPSHKRFMEEEVLNYIGNQVGDIDFDDELDKDKEYEFSVHDEGSDTYMTITMAGDGERLDIIDVGKSIRKDMTAIFESEDEGDEYHFEED